MFDIMTVNFLPARLPKDKIVFVKAKLLTFYVDKGLLSIYLFGSPDVFIDRFFCCLV